jgi:hypothetical protein
MIHTGLYTDFGDNMEFTPYKGDVANLKELQEYLDSVTILINTLKQTYGV